MTKRLVKTPKLYFLDTGLVCSETAEAGAMSGALFETWLIGQILKNWWYARQGNSTVFLL